MIKMILIGIGIYFVLCYVAARLILGPRKNWGMEEGFYFIVAPFSIPWAIKEAIKSYFK